MRKLIMILFFAVALFLTSCDLFGGSKEKTTTTTTTTEQQTTTSLQTTTSEGEQTTTTDEQTTTTSPQETTTTTEEQTTTTDQQSLLEQMMITQLQNLIDANSYEIAYHANIVTDEMTLQVDPLLTIQKYTSTADKEVYRLSYTNDALAAWGYQPFDFIIDERVETVYVNNSVDWYLGTFDEINTLAEEPIFDYLFDFENTAPASEQVEIVYLQNVILQAIVNFNSITYIDDVTDGNRTLSHYELEYNVYNVISDLFDYYNSQDTTSSYTDFEDYLSDFDLTDIFDLFKTFTVDVYLDQADLSIGRIELDIRKIMDNNIFLSYIEANVPEITDINQFLHYVQDFDLALKIQAINSVSEIIVPSEALSGIPIEQFVWPDCIPSNTNNSAPDDRDIPSTDPSPLSNEEISQAIDNLINNESFEAGIRLNIETDEVYLLVNPLLDFQKYTDSSTGKDIYRFSYHNDILAGFGYIPFEVIVDERDETIYVTNGINWYTGTFDELEYLLDVPLFDYIFDYENQVTQEELADIEFVQTTILNGIQNYNDTSYIGTVNQEGRTLYHYEISFDVRTTTETIFNHFNDPLESGYIDFNDFLNQEDELGISDLFYDFVVDVYFDENTYEIGRVEFDFAKFVNNETIASSLESLISTNEGIDVDMNQLMNYLNNFDIGITFDNINNLPEITIPTEATNGYPIEYIGAPSDLDPNSVIDINPGFTVTTDISTFNDYEFANYYRLTLTELTNISILLDFDETSSWLEAIIYDKNFNFVEDYDYLHTDILYKFLPAGTYYIRFSGTGTGNGTMTLESNAFTETALTLGNATAVDRTDENITYYTFTISDYQHINLDLHVDDNSGLSLNLYDENYHKIDHNMITFGSYIYKSLPSGTYYVFVEGNGTGQLTYDYFDSTCTDISLGDLPTLDLVNNDKQFYRVQIPATDTIAINLDYDMAYYNFYVDLYNDEFDYVQRVSSHDLDVYYNLPAGTYYVLVGGYGTGTLSIDTIGNIVPPINQGDTVTVDINDFSYFNKPIYYSFTIDTTSDISIDLGYDENDWMYYELVDSKIDHVDNTFYNNTTFVYLSLEPGTYYIILEGYGTGSGTLTLNNYQLNMQPINLGDKLQLDMTTDAGLYSFTLNEGNNIFITLSCDFYNDFLEYDLLNENFDRIDSFNYFDTTDFYDLPVGTYYISISGYGVGVLTTDTADNLGTALNMGDVVDISSIDYYKCIYSFTINQAEGITIGLSYELSNGDFYQQLFNENYEYVEALNLNNGIALYENLPAGTYYIVTHGSGTATMKLDYIESYGTTLDLGVTLDVNVDSISGYYGTMYKFVLNQTDDIMITAENHDGAYVNWTLYNGLYGYIEGDASIDDTVIFRNLPAGIYYIEIFTGGTGTVPLTVDTFHLGTTVTALDSTVEINLSSISDGSYEYFTFTLPTPQHLTITTSLDDDYSDWMVYQILNDDFDYEYVSAVYQLKDIYYLLPAGTYYIRVQGEGLNNGYLTLGTFNVQTIQTTINDTLSINVDEIVTNDIPNYYEFTLNDLQNLSIYGEFSEIDVYLYNEQFDYIDYVSCDSTYYEYENLGPGTYYIEVFGWGSGTSTISFSSDPIPYSLLIDPVDINFTSINYDDPLIYQYTNSTTQSISIDCLYEYIGDNDAYINLYDVEYHYIDPSYYRGNTPIYNDLPAGIYYIEVYGSGNPDQYVTLSVNVIEKHPVNSGEMITIDLDDAYPEETLVYYTFTINTDQTVSIDFNYDYDYDWASYHLRDLYGRYIYGMDCDTGTKLYDLAAGTYTLIIQGQGSNYIYINVIYS